jgi:hypothetical protein
MSGRPDGRLLGGASTEVAWKSSRSNLLRVAWRRQHEATGEEGP